MAELTDRDFILSLFKNRGLEAERLFPLPEFIEEIDFDNENRKKAFEMLMDDGMLIETSAAIELTEKGAEAMRNS